MSIKSVKILSLGIGLAGLWWAGFSGIEPTPSAFRSSRRKKSFSYQEADELLVRYIPPQNLLAARYMVACQGSDADVKAYRALLKKLAYPHVDIDRLSDEEVNTICFFLGQLTV